MIASMILALICRLNFDRGLAQYREYFLSFFSSLSSLSKSMMQALSTHHLFLDLIPAQRILPPRLLPLPFSSPTQEQNILTTHPLQTSACRRRSRILKLPTRSIPARRRKGSHRSRRQNASPPPLRRRERRPRVADANIHANVALPVSHRNYWLPASGV